MIVIVTVIKKVVNDDNNNHNNNNKMICWEGGEGRVGGWDDLTLLFPYHLWRISLHITYTLVLQYPSYEEDSNLCLYVCVRTGREREGECEGGIDGWWRWRDRVKRSEGWTDRKEVDKMGRGWDGWRANEREGDKEGWRDGGRDLDTFPSLTCNSFPRAIIPYF